MPSLPLPSRTPGHQPGLTVVVVLSGDLPPVTVDSLRRQDLSPDCFEVVIVRGDDAGPVGGLTPLSTRTVLAPGADPGTLRGLGLLAARGEHTIFLAAGDSLPADALARLLDAARERVIPCAGPGGSGTPRPVPAAPSEAAGLLVGPRATELALLPTGPARAAIPADGRVAGAGFWIDLAAHTPYQVAVVPGLRPEPGVEGYEDFVTVRLDDLESLRRRSGGHPRVQRLAAALRDACADDLRAHLDRFPGDRGRLIADSERRALLDPGWARINRGRARDLAVLWCFTPYLDTSGLVAARRLRERARVTDVVAQSLDGSAPLDESSRAVAGPFVGDLRLVPGPADQPEWTATRRFVQAALDEVAELTERHGPYRTVYSRAMQIPSHFAAAKLKLRHPDLHWVAEFSDPMLINPLGETRASTVEDDELLAEFRDALVAAGFDTPPEPLVYDWAERITYALADEVWFTNQQQADFMLGYCADQALADRARARTTVAHHPTPPPSLYTAVPARIHDLEPEAAHIGYFGAFYRTRGLGEILDALGDLDPSERARVRLHVFTRHPGPLHGELRERGLEDVTRVAGLLPYLEFLAASTRFDALLVNDYATADTLPVNPYLPAKVSDYLGSGTPVWAMSEPGSVMSTIPTAYSSGLGDRAGAFRVLREIVAAGPRQGGHQTDQTHAQSPMVRGRT